MKILALSGSNADNSFNLALLKFIAKHFADRYDFEVTSVKGLPLYKEGVKASDDILALGKKIEAADMVIIGSPEQQHSISSALKSVLEWLSSSVHPFKGKPVVVVSTSPMPQGGSRAQTRLKSILASPGLGSIVFNTDEFMMGTAPSQFDDQGNLTNEGTVKFLGHFFDEVNDWYNQVTK